MKTSIMAVQFKGGVIVGADSRTTTGSYIVSTDISLVRQCVYLQNTGQSCNGQVNVRS